MTQLSSISYDLPREKLQAKGSASLTNAELLQILIGSGNAQASVSRIAKRTLKVLSKHGSNVSFSELLEIGGLGPARVCQIIAAFELTTRYPMNSRQLVIDNNEKIIGLVPDVISSKYPLVAYVTVDGAQRLISKRLLRTSTSSHPSSLLRRIFSDVVADNANGLIVAIGSCDYALDPTMFELSFARDLKIMAQLFMVRVQALMLVNQSEQRSLKLDSW